MQLLTHVLAGWCVSNLFVATPKQRFACVAVSLAPDLDGVSLLGGVAAYQRFHHVVGHNLMIALLGSLVAVLATRAGVKGFLVFFLLFHLHYLMDLYGSGVGWGIAYWWPASHFQYRSLHAWEFRGWQNFSTLGVLVLWTFGIAIMRSRTPFEWIGPRLDRVGLMAIGRKPQPGATDNPDDAQRLREDH